MLIFLFSVCRVCETGSDNRPMRENRQTACEYFVDSLFEEAQKVGAKRLSPSEQKKPVNARHFFLFQCFSKGGPSAGLWGQNCCQSSKVSFTWSLYWLGADTSVMLGVKLLAP